MGGTAAADASLQGNPEKLPTDDVTFIQAMTHERVGHHGEGLWHNKHMQLPAYIQHIANDLIHERGFTTSRAIATAVSRCKVWCAGGDNVKADTRAKACAAVAAWEALKVKTHLKPNEHDRHPGGDHRGSADDVNAGFLWDSSKHPRKPKGAGGGQFAQGNNSPAPTNEKPVAQGQSGKQVKDLQHRLSEVGHHLKQDGQFGEKTDAAVRKYQKEHGLKVDGLVGPKTTAALRRKHPADHKKPVRKRKQTASGLPELVTMPGVDLVAAGSWDLSSGRNTFTREDIQNAIEAAKCPAVGPPVIKLGHVDPRFDGEPAIGRVTNLRADESGNKLLGDLADMPGWFGSIANAAYPKRSIEGSYGFKCQIGHDHPFVITGLALLGVTAPGVGVLGGLPDIASLYGIHAAAAGEVFRTAPQDIEGDVVAVTEEDVRRAYYANSGAPPTWWITELQMSPTQLVVAGTDGDIYRVPFTIEGEDGDVSFGEAELIKDFAELTASRGTGHVVTYASAAASKTFIPEDDDGDGDGSADEGDDAPDVTAGEGDSTRPGKHGKFTGTHTHPHNAYGAQEGDESHSHSHSHKGDDVHKHAHATGPGADKDGGSEVEFTSEQEANLRSALGLGEDDEMTPEAVLTASAALRESADKKVAAAKRSLPPGVIQVSQEVWDNLNNKVEASARFQAKVMRNERDEVIDKAIRDGKFTAASRNVWVRQWDIDPDAARDTLATLKKNVVPVSDLGVGGGNLDDEAYEAEFAGLYPPGTYGKGN